MFFFPKPQINHFNFIDPTNLPNFLQIIDLVTGKTLQPQERGEICLKGPTITKGYLNNPEMTKETIDGDGWLHMGNEFTILLRL